MYRRIFEYSRKDPRYKGEATVLRDITQAVPARYRGYIVAISVVKQCLHPISPDVPKYDRSVHMERVYSWVVRHDNSIQQTPKTAKRQHLDDILEGHKVHSVELPYTLHELKKLPLKDIVTTNYSQKTHASVELRGVERRVDLRHLVLASLLSV
jgi:hypothetical protein